jgi:hypothetical protein
MFVPLSMYDLCDEFIDSPFRSRKMEEAQQFGNCLVCRGTSKSSFQREDKKRPPLDVLTYWREPFKICSRRIQHEPYKNVPHSNFRFVQAARWAAHSL